jgi:hypothetical protein
MSRALIRTPSAFGFVCHVACNPESAGLRRSIMPASRIAHIAKIQSKATGRNYQSILEWLSAAKKADGAFPAMPTAAQQQLEGLFINRLETLKSRPTQGIARSREIFGFDRIDAGSNHLTLTLKPASDLKHLALQVLPVISEDGTGGVPEIWGVPGLRATEHPKGTSLHRPGLDAEIILVNVRPTDLERAHIAAFTGPHETVRCVGGDNPDAWTAAELAFVAEYKETLDQPAFVESAIFRRTCLFNELDPLTVRTWRSSPVTTTVELYVEDFGSDHLEALQSLVTSRYLVPRLELQSKHAQVDEGWGRLTLSCSGSGSNELIDLRISRR